MADFVTARYAVSAYDWLLTPFEWYTGEQFAQAIERYSVDSPRTRAIAQSVRECVKSIFHTPYETKYRFKNQ